MQNSARELQHLDSGLDFITVMKLHKHCLSPPACCAASRSLPCSSAASARSLPAAGLGAAGKQVGHAGLPPSAGVPGLGSPGLHHWHAAPGRTASALEEMRAQSRAAPHRPHRPHLGLRKVRARLPLLRGTGGTVAARGGSAPERERKLKQKMPLKKKMLKGAELGWIGGNCRDGVSVLRLKGSGQL